MNRRLKSPGRLLPPLLALLAGALAPLSFSPLGWWPAGLLSVMALLALLHRYGATRPALLGWCYGLGFFGAGVSWVYVSIEVYGNAGPLLAGFLTLALVMGLALFFALQCWLFQRFLRGRFTALGFAGLWVLFEWLRGWLLTGFPWLYLGYAHAGTWLGGLAPVFGVLGVSFAVVLSAALLVQLYRHYSATEHIFDDHRPVLLVSLLALWAIPALLGTVNWVRPSGDTASVGLVQANIPQGRKFDRDFLQQTLDRYEDLSAPLWGRDIVLWPETAIPLLYQQAGPVLDRFGGRAQAAGSGLVSGILYRGGDGSIHNSVISLGAGSGAYHKQKLVPFGEYVPLEGLLNNLLQVFNLPMSSLRPGPPDQQPLHAAGLSLAPYICYEVVYPDFVRRTARGADVLVTISNDTWFGRSWGPWQHLQMAAMRALENGRYMIRATNNGVSAIIDERGRILSQSGQFRAEVLEGEVELLEGRTPFSYWGSWPVVALGALVLVPALLRRRRR